MAEPIDPRRAAFASVAVRPAATLPATDTGEPEPEQPVEPVLRGVGGPPPPKPAHVHAEPTNDLPAEPPAPTPPPPLARQSGPRRDARNSRSGGGPAGKDTERRHIGTRRGNLVYLQTQITPGLSARLDQLANEEDVVLGEVLMRCVRAFRPENPTTHPRRRRRSGNQVRREIGVLPSEAAEVMGAMTTANLTVSAFLRQALERHLG